MGLRLRLVAAVALFNVDMLGFPEDPCLGECVPKGDLGLLDAVLLLLLCFGLLYTGECLGLGRAEDCPAISPKDTPAALPPAFGEDEAAGVENLRTTPLPDDPSVIPGEFWREYIFSGGPMGESSRFFLRFFSFCVSFDELPDELLLELEFEEEEEDDEEELLS